MNISLGWKIWYLPISLWYLEVANSAANRIVVGQRDKIPTSQSTPQGYQNATARYATQRITFPWKFKISRDQDKTQRGTNSITRTAQWVKLLCVLKKTCHLQGQNEKIDTRISWGNHSALKIKKKGEQTEHSGYLCISCRVNSGMHRLVLYLYIYLFPCSLLKLINNSFFSLHLLEKCWSFSYLFSKLNPEVVKDARLITLCLPAAHKTARLQPTQRTNSAAYHCRQTRRVQPSAVPAISQSQESKGSLRFTRLIV